MKNKNDQILAIGAYLVGIALTAFLAIKLKNYMDQNRMYRAVNQIIPMPLPVQRKSFNAIVSKFQKYGNGDKRILAYLLAQEWTEQQFANIPEIASGNADQLKYWPSQKHDNVTYYGRGLSAITHKANYQRVQDKTGWNIVENPNQLIGPSNDAINKSAEIYVRWLVEPYFIRDNGKTLLDYFNENKEDWYNARRLYNGTDKAQQIASLAKQIYTAIQPA